MPFLTTHTPAKISGIDKFNEFAYIRDPKNNPKDANDMNWLSLDQLNANDHLLDDSQRSQLRGLCAVNSLNKHCGAYYLGNAVMLTMANWSDAESIVNCGVYDAYKVWKKSCGKPKYCDKCATMVREKKVSKYSHIFASTPEPCYFVTLTIKDTHILLQDANHAAINATWDRLHAYVDQMRSSGLISGAFAREELAVTDYVPHIRVNPHIHLVCTAKEGLHSHDCADISIHVKLISTKEHFEAEIRYMLKPLSLMKRYETQWTPENARQINKNVLAFVEGYKAATLNRKQLRQFGTFAVGEKGLNIKSDKAMKRDYLRRKAWHAKKTCAKGK